MKIQIQTFLSRILFPWGQALRETLTSRFFMTYVVVVMLFGILIRGLSHIYGAGFMMTGALYTQPVIVSVIVSVICFLVVRFLQIVIIIHPPRPISYIYKDFRDNWFAPRRIVQGVLVMALIPVFFSFFTSAKNMIPAIQPFAWDPVFSEADRMIHFGTQPWQWLHPLLGTAAVTATISFLYKSWFFSKYMVIFWQAFTLRYPNLRAQFFITMCLSWIVNGFILATLFSAAGPCFYAYFYPDLPNPYADLMTYIRESDKVIHVYDLFAMDYLMQAYHEKKSAFFSGISALPSMHVSVAFLNVLLGFRINRVLGYAFTAYLLVIMVGSVHIGWHYAVDGYVAIITTLILWKLVGRFFPQDEMETK